MRNQVDFFKYVFMYLKDLVFLLPVVCVLLFSSVVTAQEFKKIDILLMKNSHEYSMCINNSLGIFLKIITCSTNSLKNLDEGLLGLIDSRKLDKEASETFFKKRKISCVSKSDDSDGTNGELIFADCLRIKTIEEIIKKSHNIENIDDFLFEVMESNKVPDSEREFFFKNRKKFCTDAIKFRANYFDTVDQDRFYKDCLVVRAIEEYLKRLN